MKWTGRSAAAKLKTAERAELLARWRATTGRRRRLPELLAMALAWHLQERKYGGLKPLVQRRLEALANAYRRGKLIWPPSFIKRGIADAASVSVNAMGRQHGRGRLEEGSALFRFELHSREG
jgi:Protein of unknown function (DUF2924)